LTRNGKLDRAALPAPDSARPELEGAYVAPSGATEEGVAKIWSDLLGVDRVGAEDRFFDLGGHSLLAVQLLSRIRREFQVEVSLQQFFDGPTVTKMAAVVAGAAKDEEIGELDDLFSMVEAMAPADIAAEIARKEGQE
jgi:acyl carrier protein